MTARIYTPQALASGISISLPPAAARHVQVLRFQPGDALTLFNGQGDVEGEFNATIQTMGRSDVQVTVGDFVATQSGSGYVVHLAAGMPANERMDWLVEKATELGVASIQPLMTERSVLRLSGERAEKKRLHWQAVASAACEQCGRNRVPVIHSPAHLNDWLKGSNMVNSFMNSSMNSSAASAIEGTRLLLSLQAHTQTLAKTIDSAAKTNKTVTFLSGPEGGLSTLEENAALANGYTPISLGQRVLRSETAPIACLSYLMLTGNQ